MFVQIKPIYGINYRAGQIYCCYEIGSTISGGISWFSYKTGDTPELEKISHVGVCIGEGRGVSAQPQGIDIENLNNIFNDPKRRIFFVEPVLLDTLGAEPLVQGIINRIGEKYDWKLILGFGIVNSWFGKMLSDRIKAEILRIFNCKGRAVCSEVLAQELYNKGYCKDKNTIKLPREIVECGCVKKWKRE